MPRIFDRFYCGSRQGWDDGIGLGLYISHVIVEAYGGRIWCESEVGKASTFALPVVLASPASGITDGAQVS